MDAGRHLIDRGDIRVDDFGIIFPVETVEGVVYVSDGFDDHLESALIEEIEVMGNLWGFGNGMVELG